MKHTLQLLCACLIGLPAAVIAAEEVVISDDGHQIQLNGDGTWVQLSKDRFATDTDGRRIRLRPDGTWSIVGSDLVVGEKMQRDVATPAPRPQLLDEPVLFLERVELLKKRRKRAKSSHAELKMFFQVTIRNESTRTLDLASVRASQLTARSSRGTAYSVTEVIPTARTVEPGQTAELSVWADDGPQWFGIKYLSLEFPANTVGNSATRILSKNMDQVVRREVDSF